MSLRTSSIQIKKQKCELIRNFCLPAFFNLLCARPVWLDRGLTPGGSRSHVHKSKTPLASNITSRRHQTFLWKQEDWVTLFGAMVD